MGNYEAALVWLNKAVKLGVGSKSKVETCFQPLRDLPEFQTILNEIDGFEILEINHPLFKTPTTGAIKGSSFYFIANTQLHCFYEDF
jgi:hypothetical protein